MINNYSNISSKIAGFPDNSFQSIFLGFAFNNSIASGFGFSDNQFHFIFVGFSFNNFMALEFADNSPQDIFLLFFLIIQLLLDLYWMINLPNLF
jgi:hypothetical protein